MTDREVTSWVLALGATFAQWFWGGWTFPLQVLVAFMLVDYMLGVLAAWKRGEQISYEAGALGLAKKVAILSVVGVAHLLNQLLGLPEPVLRNAVMWAYTFNELWSIIRNASEVGIPVPDALRIAVTRGQNGKTGSTDKRNESLFLGRGGGL